MGPPVFVLWSLVGCPFVFGGPDLSRVDGDDPPPVPDTGTPTDSDPDTDTDTEPTSTDTDPTPGPTGDTGPPPEPPEVSGLEVEARSLGASLMFLVSDVHGDLDGGTVHVTDGTLTKDYLVPDDLLAFDGSTGEVALSWEVPDPCLGIDATFEVTMTDLGGLTSAPATAALLVNALTHEEPSDPLNLGVVGLPLVVCGEIDGFEEYDYVRFQVPLPGVHLLSLTWNNSADLALYVTNEQGIEIGYSDAIGPDLQPEDVAASLSEGAVYTAEVKHWLGILPHVWTLLILGP